MVALPTFICLLQRSRANPSPTNVSSVHFLDSNCLSSIKQPIPSLHSSNCYHAKSTPPRKKHSLTLQPAEIYRVNSSKYLVVLEELKFKGCKLWRRKERKVWRIVKCHEGSWTFRGVACAQWKEHWPWSHTDLDSYSSYIIIVCQVMFQVLYIVIHLIFSTALGDKNN